jgi:hypothetical protein
MAKKTAIIIAALLMKLATVAFSQQTQTAATQSVPTVESIERIVFECLTQCKHHVGQARQAMARGERSERELMGVSGENESIRLSSLAADFHADCIKDTIQTRYANSGKGINLNYGIDFRDGVFSSGRGAIFTWVGDLPSREQAALTNMYTESSEIDWRSIGNGLLNIDMNVLSDETWYKISQGRAARRRDFNAQGLDRIRE